MGKCPITGERCALLENIEDQAHPGMSDVQAGLLLRVLSTSRERLDQHNCQPVHEKAVAGRMIICGNEQAQEIGQRAMELMDVAGIPTEDIGSITNKLIN